MKKATCVLLLLCLVQFSFGQESPTAKTYKNEFGIDATSFVKQFLNFNSGVTGDYNPVYYLTYRRHFKGGNIRFAVGINFSQTEINSANIEDHNLYTSKSYGFNTRIGWEFVNELSKRWQVFYGLDYRPGYSYAKNDAPYFNGGYANGFETKISNQAIAPLMGFRFWLTKRLSISTEVSFSVNVQQKDSRYYFIPTTAAYPPMPDMHKPKTTNIYTSFTQPLSLFVTFDI